MLKLNNELIVEASTSVVSPKLYTINTKTNTKLFSLYLTFANGVGDSITHVNGNFKPFFLGTLAKHTTPYINVTKLIHM